MACVKLDNLLTREKFSRFWENGSPLHLPNNTNTRLIDWMRCKLETFLFCFNWKLYSRLDWHVHSAHILLAFCSVLSILWRGSGSKDPQKLPDFSARITEISTAALHYARIGTTEIFLVTQRKLTSERKQKKIPADAWTRVSRRAKPCWEWETC